MELVEGDDLSQRIKKGAIPRWALSGHRPSWRAPALRRSSGVSPIRSAECRCRLMVVRSLGWDQTGRGVHYYSGGAVWSTPVTVQPTLADGRPSRMFAIAGDIAGEVALPRRRVMPDGHRFLALEGPPSSGVQLLVVRHGLQRLLSAAAK